MASIRSVPRRSARRDAPQSFDRLQESLSEPALSLAAATAGLVRAALPHSHSTRSWTRVYGIDKMLAWKLLQIRDATEVAGVLGHLPGRGGIRLIARRLRAGGCAEAPIELFEQAAIGLWDLLASERVDRHTLSALGAGGLDQAWEIRARRRDRRALRSSGERLWGIGVEARTNSYLVTPSRSEGMLDVAYVAMLDGLRVLRRGEPWCIFSPGVSYETPPSELDAPPPGPEMISKTPDSGGPIDRTDPMEPMLSSLSDEVGRRAIARHPTSGTRHLYVDRAAVPLGKPFRVAFGEYIPRIGSSEAASPGELAMLNARITTPIAMLAIEILMHRSMVPPASNPTALGFMTIDPTQRRPFERPLRMPIDGALSVVPIRKLVAGTDEAAAARLSLLTLAANRVRSSVSEFTAHRIEIADPPLGSTISVRWRLPVRT